MIQAAVKLTGTEDNYIENLAYFFETLTGSKYIDDISECVFLIEKSALENNQSLSEFLNEHAIPYKIFSSTSPFRKLFLKQIKEQKKVTLLFIPHKIERTPLPDIYVAILKKLTNLVVFTGTNFNAEIFAPIHTWSTLFLNNYPI